MQMAFSDEWCWRDTVTNYDRAFNKSTQAIKLTTHVHPVPRLRMSGGIPLLPCIPTVHRDFTFLLNIPDSQSFMRFRNNLAFFIILLLVRCSLSTAVQWGSIWSRNGTTNGYSISGYQQEGGTLMCLWYVNAKILYICMAYMLLSSKWLGYSTIS